MKEIILKNENSQQIKDIEKSIIKKFRKEIWRKFVKSVSDYELICEGDSVAVCISGGKDSMLLAKCIQELSRHWIVKFNTQFIVMDPGYNKKNREKIEKNCEILGIPAKIYESDIFASVEHMDGSPCYMCARMRRGHLYKFAQDLGCNKIALGHHFDDVIETILMSTLYGAEYRTMMPKLKSKNFEGMELIRPLYMVKEKSVIDWAAYNGLEFIRCACRFTEQSEEKENLSKRKMVKKLIAELKKDNDYVDINIFNSVHNVNLETLIGYRDKNGKHSFLDEY